MRGAAIFRAKTFYIGIIVLGLGLVVAAASLLLSPKKPQYSAEAILQPRILKHLLSSRQLVHQPMQPPAPQPPIYPQPSAVQPQATPDPSPYVPQPSAQQPVPQEQPQPPTYPS